jgi:hypothetical protein
MIPRDTRNPRKIGGRTYVVMNSTLQPPKFPERNALLLQQPNRAADRAYGPRRPSRLRPGLTLACLAADYAGPLETAMRLPSITVGDALRPSAVAER